MAVTVRTSADLGLGAIARIAFAGAQIELAPEALERVRVARAETTDALARGSRVYGVNTGLGYQVGRDVEPGSGPAHERSLLLGRAVGSAPFLPAAEARALLAVRLAGFLTGRAGVTPELCERLASCLNAGFTPAIPRESVGCAGEIIPLAHAFSALMGEGMVVGPDGSTSGAAEVLKDLGIGPWGPAVKEGIALLGGAPGAIALGIARLRAVRSVAGSALVSAAAAIDAASVPLSPYDPALGRLSGDALLEDVLARFDRLLGRAGEAGGIREVGEVGEVGEGAGATAAPLQAPVSFRVAPQVQAHLERTAGRFEEDLRLALGAVTDSPALVGGRFVSNGGFHQIGVAAGMDTLTAALARIGELAAQRLHRLLDGRVTGLADQLSPGPGPGCGLVAVHKRAVGSLAALRHLTTPASVGAADTSLGQEDAMTFSFEAASRLHRALALVRDLLACELLAARQAWWLRRRAGGQAPAPGLAAVEALLAEAVAAVITDRPLGSDIDRIAAIVQESKLPGTPDGGDSLR
jgi:histidine ammonia-lyase